METIRLGATTGADLSNLEDGNCRGLSFGETELFVVKHDGLLYAYINRCPHLGIALEWLEDQFLDVEKQFIHCSTHGALFLIDSGECVSGPCQGEFLEPVEICYHGDEITFFRAANAG